MKKLLRSLDSSFDTLALMIQERGDYKSLDPADILKRINTHEFQLAEKRDLYGPSYGRSRALKAKAVSESEREDSDSSLSDPEELSQEVAMLVRKFHKFSRRGCRCQNRRISGRGSRTVHLRSMVTGDRGHDFYLGPGPLYGGNTLLPA